MFSDLRLLSIFLRVLPPRAAHRSLSARYMTPTIYSRPCPASHSLVASLSPPAPGAPLARLSWHRTRGRQPCQSHDHPGSFPLRLHRHHFKTEVSLLLSSIHPSPCCRLLAIHRCRSFHHCHIPQLSSHHLPIFFIFPHISSSLSFYTFVFILTFITTTFLLSTTLATFNTPFTTHLPSTLHHVVRTFTAIICTCICLHLPCSSSTHTRPRHHTPPHSRASLRLGLSPARLIVLLQACLNTVNALHSVYLYLQLQRLDSTAFLQSPSFPLLHAINNSFEEPLLSSVVAPSRV